MATRTTYGSSYGSTGRSLPPGPGPLDPAGKPLKSRTSSLSTGPMRVDHTVTYETTTKLRPDTNKRSTGIAELSSDRVGSYPGSYRSRIDTSDLTTGSYRSSTLNYGTSRFTDRYERSTTVTTTYPRRRSASSDKIGGHLEPSYRDSTSTITGRTSTLSLSSSSTQTKDNCGLTGLRNLRNTCFMNSILQCLSNTKPLLEYCLNDQFMMDINEKTSHMRGQLIKSYANLMKELWKKNGDSCVSPTAFKSSIAKFAPRFVGYSQQDAQEFLRYLLEGLHEDVNRVTSRPKLPAITEEEDAKLSDKEKPKYYWDRYLRLEKSIVVDIFVGQLRSTLKCTECDYESLTFDPFWDLSLPLPKYSSSLNVTDCIKLFTNEEVLDGDEKPTCARCKARRKCTKRFSIQRFPQVLVLHLKRFSGERFRSKLSTSVSFPLNDLDLTQFAADQNGISHCKYNLTGVSNHSGTVFSGHYTAYCKHPYREDWHEYNDQSVRAVPSRSIVSSEAYVLFYELSDKKSRL